MKTPETSQKYIGAPIIGGTLHTWRHGIRSLIHVDDI